MNKIEFIDSRDMIISGENSGESKNSLYIGEFE
jgi:hypothetical protein